MAVAITPSNAKEQALKSLNKLPPFSPTLNRLLATLSREDVSFAKIADLIEKDAVLAGNVLGLVNSAVYGRRERVNSVRHAVSLLGVTKLRNAALSMSITRMWAQVRTPPGWSMANFNQHSIGTAMLCDLLSQEAPVAYPEGAFIAGLLHDLGKLLLAVGLPDSYAEIDRLAALGKQPRIECERTVLGFTHAELSGEAMQAWNLPEPMQIAVTYHENPEEDPTPAEDSTYPLSRVVAASDAYVNNLGIRIQTLPALPAETAAHSLESLRVGDSLQRLLNEFHAEFEGIKSFF